MAGSLNRVQLIGNLGSDPEVRTFQNGGRVCNLRLATAEQWKDRNTGERHERTEWHTVAIFADGLVTVAERYLRKGSKVFVEGQLQTRKWQDQSGNDRYSTEVVLRPYSGQLIMLGERSGGSGGGGASGGSSDRGSSGGDWGSGSGGGSASNERRYGGGVNSDSGGTGQSNFGDDLDDDIPF